MNRIREHIEKTALNTFHKQNGLSEFQEGFSQQFAEQCELLVTLAVNAQNVMEIGFNGGHSADIFLFGNKNMSLVSFDIGEHDYVKTGKEFIDNTYPDRHTLILGNSLTTIPDYIKGNNGIKFDLIFIDGGHDYDTAKGDINNCRELAHPDTVVIMDDTVGDPDGVRHWNVGPNKAWDEAKNCGMIEEFGSMDFRAGRGHSWGIYNHA